MREVRACVRGAEALEVASEDHEVEVWEKAGCAERIERAPFLDLGRPFDPARSDPGTDQRP